MMNEKKFTGKADNYTKYRPSYPSEFINYLFSEIGLKKDSVIADIGSGTGKLTELLLKQGCFVYGVEPNDDMRNVAENLFVNDPSFISINASAERTGLPNESVNYITVAQAFHWFDREAFRKECQRILKRHGKVVLVWNCRDRDSEVVMENDLVNQKFCPSFKGFSGGHRGECPEEYNDFFNDGICEYRTFRYDVVFDETSFIGRNLSASYAPKENDENYIPYIKELKAIYNKHCNSEGLIMPNITRSYVGFCDSIKINI